MNYTNPYFNNYQPNMQYGNQFYQPQQMQQTLQPRIQPEQFMNNKPMGLQGKIVDNADVVKATDIPLDGSVSYFPLTDGSAIVTKQLQQDGTSKIIVYKPVTTDESEVKEKYVTETELTNAIKNIDINAWKEENKLIKKQLKDISRDIEDLKEGK